MKLKMKNTKTQSFELVSQMLKHSPVWDSMRIIVKTGNQKNSTHVNVK
jgi:hypothetical protein